MTSGDRKVGTQGGRPARPQAPRWGLVLGLLSVAIMAGVVGYGRHLPALVPAVSVRPELEVRAGHGAVEAKPYRIGESAAVGDHEGSFAAAQVWQRQALNKEILRVPALRAATGADGQGVRVAVIDTGVDLAHPALGPRPDGRPRVSHWVDLTGRGTFDERVKGLPGTRPAEGDVALTGAAAAAGDTVLIEGLSVNLGGVRSRSNRYRYGWLSIQGALAAALDVPNVPILVLAVDTQVAGVYDRVLLALGPDPDFTGVEVLAPYQFNRSVALLPVHGTDPGTAGAVMGLVLNELAADGSYANIGFDGNSHGTHVAGLVAGHQEGWFEGTAPGAELLVLKALSARGEGSWSQIAAALAAAVDFQADLITISISGLGVLAGDGEAESRYLRDAAGRCGCLVILSTGNNGPGLGTASTPGDNDFTLTVGAYTSPDLVAIDYGLAIGGEGVAHYSGVGPRPDGSLAPVVLAPGAALGPVPFWNDPGGYRLMEGTSMAAPQAAGVAALLIEGARKAGIVPEPPRLRRAFERGARSLADALLVEQGFGLVDAYAAWVALPGVVADPADLYFTGTVAGERVLNKGLYRRDPGPGNLSWTLRNTGRRDRGWYIVPSAAWIQSEQRAVSIAAGAERSLSLTYRPPAQEGVHAGWLQVNSAAGQPAAAVLHTVVRPVPALGPAGTGLVRTGGLAAGSRQRLFLQVEPGTRRLQVAISHRGPAGTPRLYASLYDAEGRQRSQAVLGSSEGQILRREFIVPAAGAWELVLYAASTLDAKQVANFRVEVTGAQVRWEPTAWSLNRAAGLASARLLKLQALGESFKGRLMLLGYGSQPYSEQSASILVPAGSGASHEIVVPPDSNFLEVAALSLADNGLPIDLYLFRLDPDQAVPVEVGHHRTLGGRPAVVQAVTPTPGRYVAWLELAEGGEVELRHRLQTGAVDGLGAGVQEVRLGAGASRTVLIHFRPNVAATDSFGVVGIVDEGYGLWVGAVPVQVGSRRPAPVFVLRRAGGPDGELVLDVLSNWRPAQGSLIVGGRRYELRSGRAYLPAAALDDSGHLQVDLLDAAGNSRGIWTLTDGRLHYATAGS